MDWRVRTLLCNWRVIPLMLAAALGACSPSAEPSSRGRVERSEFGFSEWAWPDDAATRSFADFRPSRHGFRFRNAFTGSPLPFSLGGLEKHLNLPKQYGLCGGMSFAAADYFVAQLDPPAATAPPVRGDELYEYIYGRQVDSLGEAMAQVVKFASWMAMPDNDVFGPHFLTVKEVGPVLRDIQAGRPALLGLVLTSTASSGMLWENHQVMAYAVRRRGADGLDLEIYDPNFPGNDDVVLALTFRRAAPILIGEGPVPHRILFPSAEVVRKARGRRDTSVRGFFRMPYAPKMPPIEP